MIALKPVLDQFVLKVEHKDVVSVDTDHFVADNQVLLASLALLLFRHIVHVSISDVKFVVPPDVVLRLKGFHVE